MTLAAEVQKEDDESMQVKGENWMQIHQDQRIRHSFFSSFLAEFSTHFLEGRKKTSVCVFVLFLKCLIYN